MRTFIAIELPKEIKALLAKLQEQLKTSGADVKWVEPNNIHLTLKFLGERDEKKINRIAAIIEDVTKNTISFKIRICSTGAFPKITSPRVIWVGIDSGNKETGDIAKVFEEQIAKLGIPKEDRPFSSHITIGRTRSSLNQDKLVMALEMQKNIFYGKELEFIATKITLFKSTLTPKGPVYEALKEASLQII